MVKKVIKEMNYQMQDGTEIYKYSIKNPVLLSAVFNYMKDDDSETRELSSLCFMQFCRILITKKMLNDDDYIKFCIFMFDDTNSNVRLNSVKGLIYYSQSRYGIDSLLRNKILEKVILKIKEEKDEVVLDNFLTLHSEILNSEGAPQIALENDIINILKDYVEHKNLKIVDNVILNLGSLSLCEQGKKACVDANLIEKIFIHLEKLKELKILIACTRFLMSVSILKAGKVQIFEKNGFDFCLKLLDLFDDQQLTLNILQIIGNVAEEPRGRKKMLENLVFIDRYLDHEFLLIKSQAKITKDIIIWKP